MLLFCLSSHSIAQATEVYCTFPTFYPHVSYISKLPEKYLFSWQGIFQMFHIWSCSVQTEPLTLPVCFFFFHNGSLQYKQYAKLFAHLLRGLVLNQQGSVTELAAWLLTVATTEARLQAQRSASSLVCGRTGTIQAAGMCVLRGKLDAGEKDMPCSL